MALLVTNATLRAAIARRGFRDPEPGRLHLFGLRGARPYDGHPGEVQIVETVLNEYTAAIGCFGTSLKLYRGSVDPGRDFTADPMNPEGAAHLQDGCWLYQPGSHKGHRALVQAAPVKVARDKNRDGTIEPGEPVSTGYFGVDIHAGGASPAVGEWSAGCQVIRGGWTGEPWVEFLDTVAAANQSLYRYYLLDGKDLEP